MFAFIMLVWFATWGPYDVLAPVPHHGLERMGWLFIIGLFACFIALIFRIYIRRNVNGASSVRYQDSENKLHDHADMPESVRGEYRDHRDQKIHGIILETPDCGWFRRVRVYNVDTYSWEFSRARRGMVRMRNIDGEVVLYPSAVMRMFPQDDPTPPYGIECLIAEAMEHRVLVRELDEKKDLLTNARIMCGVLGRTIAAVVLYIGQTKKQQRVKIAARAGDLLVTGVGLADNDGSYWSGWQNQAEHMLHHLEHMLDSVAPSDVKPSHV
jgi:hypothetical protein